MRITYPFTERVEHFAWVRRDSWTQDHSCYHLRNYAVVDSDLDREQVVVAPSGLAWLYRVLPNWIGGSPSKSLRVPGYFLFNVAAPLWLVGIRMAYPRHEYRTAPLVLPTLVVGWRERGWYLPWGAWLIGRLTGYPA